MRNIEEAAKMRLMDAKTLAIVVFGAQLNDTAKHHVMRFMAEYLAKCQVLAKLQEAKTCAD